MTDETTPAEAGGESEPVSKIDAIITEAARKTEAEDQPEQSEKSQEPDTEETKELSSEEKAAQAEKQRERQRKRADRNLFKYEREREAKQRAERRLSEISAAQAELEKKGAPKISDFEGRPYEDYLDAITEWKIERKSIESQRATAEKEAKEVNDSLAAIEQEDEQELQQATNINVGEARKTFPDMDKLGEKYGDIPVPDHIWRVFQKTDNPGFALYSVMKDGALEDICAMDPMRAAMVIARHEDKALALAKPKTVSDAPAPRSSPGGGGASGGKTVERMSGKELLSIIRSS